MSLTIEELSELEDKIIEELPYKITAVLSKLNRSDRLEEFLEMIDMTELLEKKQDFYSYKEGKIVVIGGTKVKEEVLLGIASKLGIDKNRFEFYLDFIWIINIYKKLILEKCNMHHSIELFYLDLCHIVDMEKEIVEVY